MQRVKLAACGVVLALVGFGLGRVTAERGRTQADREVEVRVLEGLISEVEACRAGYVAKRK